MFCIGRNHPNSTNGLTAYYSENHIHRKLYIYEYLYTYIVYIYLCIVNIIYNT